MNILVVHGPNLNLLGHRPGDERGQTLAALDAQLIHRAAALGLELRIVQSNHEGELVEALHHARAWAKGVVINPDALAHSSYVLREALWAVGLPAIEVHLTDIRRRESWRRRSVLKDVCAAQVVGKGFGSYFEALERFASGDLEGKRRRPSQKQKALKVAQKKGRAAAPAPVKSLGRRVQAAQASTAAPASAFLTRALVRQKIAERLGGKLSPAGLSTWARSRWLDVQRGAPAESGHREVLEDCLQQLVLSAVPPAKLTEDQLIELMAQLGE